MNKSFVITVDTESDNQWDVKKSQETQNAMFIPRFQELCEKYLFKPVYLVDYSMANDEFLVDYLNERCKQGMCEIGMHLHAWDTPPFYDLDTKKDTRPYLIEYSYEFMEKKIQMLDSILRSKFDCDIISHRAGRWAMNEDYFTLLQKYGYKIDCSYTPGIDWSKVIGGTRGGTDYSKAMCTPWIHSSTGILEVPVTVRKIRYMNRFSIREIAKGIIGRKVWLRPALYSNDEMKKVISLNKTNISEFMMHSSELMPGGSPYFETKEDIEKLYERLDEFFAFASISHKGKTLSELYYEQII